MEQKTNIISKESRDIFSKRENKEFHSSFAMEKKIFGYLARGDKTNFNKMYYQNLITIGNTTDSELKTVKYATITFYALAIRVCIENGLEESRAYDISDKIIALIDRVNDFNDFHILTDYNNLLLDEMYKLKYGYSSNQYVSLAIEYISRNLHSKISRDDIANKLAITPTYLSALFKKEMGKSLTDYIIDVKIDEAKNIIKTMNYSTTKMCYILGFSSEAYFCKVFKDKVGMTIKEYKKYINQYYKKGID